MAILKSLKYKSCLSLGTCHKYLVEFTESTRKIYWTVRRNKLAFFKYASTKYNAIKTMLL